MQDHDVDDDDDDEEDVGSSGGLGLAAVKTLIEVQPKTWNLFKNNKNGHQRLSRKSNQRGFPETDNNRIEKIMFV